MEVNVLDALRNEYSDLNKREKQVARYILENSRDAIHMSISELAKGSDVSETTVFRLANRMGFKGFYDFKVALISSTVTPMENIHGEIEPGDDLYIMMQKLISGYTESFKKTIEHNTEEGMNELIKKLSKAKTVYYFGNGGSYPLAVDCHHKLIRTGVNGIPLSDPHWMSMYLSLAEPEDVVMFFSSSGRNRELLQLAEVAKEKNLYTAVITAETNSPLAEACDNVLIAYGREYNLRYEALESRLSTALVVDTLYLKLATLNNKQQNKSLSNIKKIRESIAGHRE